MSAGYEDVRVTAGATTSVEFTLRNESGETWRAAEGFRVGYHLFDSHTGTLIVDGERAEIGDLKPGESAAVHLHFDWPPEDGRYRVLISPMREGVRWYYESGWPALALEGEALAGALEIGPARVTTIGQIRRRNTVRAIGRAFVYPWLTMWRNRGLIRVMVRRDILGRYRGSFGGSFWTIFNPLLLILTYFFVFGYVLNDRPDHTEFARYLLGGMLPWLAFSEAVGRAPSVLMEHRNFVRKLVFAVETLPLNLVFAGLVTECFALVLYCGFLLATGQPVPVTVLWLPVLLIPQMMFTAGLSWFLAALGAMVRDLGQIIGFLLTIWFFLTPICYDESLLMKRAPWVAGLLFKNPMYQLVHGYRRVFLYGGNAPEFDHLWKFWVLALVVFVGGHAWFYKFRKSFADML